MGPGRVVTTQPVGDVPEELSGRNVGDVMLHAPQVIAPTATVADLHAFFGDDHLHAALVVDASGRLLTVVERADLRGHGPAEAATDLGRLADRTLAVETDLPEAWLLMRRSGRRRLAVVDPHTHLLLGLLCLRRSGLGFCTDAGVAERRAARDLGRADRSADPS
ncbi:MAG: CBS domain-containing protein [Nocardioides sp.]